jgi:hypothetical protein
MALVGEAKAGRLGEAEGRPLLDLLHRHMARGRPAEPNAAADGGA